MGAPILAFPTPLPGEFFGSLLLRYHGVYGSRRLSCTLCDTLGLGRGAIRNLPTKLGQLAARLPAVWVGGVDAILEAHTVWPVYRPFLTRHAASFAYRRIVEGPPGSLQLTLGDATARLTLQRQLQACTCCFAEDAETYGVGYLHVEHQLPGVHACVQHNMGLVDVRVPDGADQGGFKITLPTHGHARQEAFPGEVEFARLSATLHSAQVPRLTPKLLALAYSERLRALDLLTRKGYLRTRALGDLVLSRFPEAMLGRIGIVRKAPQGWMPSMLHRLQRGHHPVKHLLYIGALFGSVESFVEALPQRELPFNAPASPAPRRDIGAEIAQQMGQNQESMIRVSKRLGVSINTVITQAKRLGIQVNSRPKRIRFALVRRIERKAGRGTSIAKICSAEHVSPATVYRTIEANPCVEAARRDALERRQRKRCRKQWQKQLRHAALRRKVARSRAPAAYAWLYRHDRAWLMRRHDEHRR